VMACLLAIAAAWTSSSSLAALSPLRAVGSRSALLRLRGGEDAPPPSVAPTALSREEITAKLNGVPVFCILNKDGGVVSMPDREDTSKSICRWFVDANEAKAVLELAIQNNPQLTGLHMGVHGLGNAFKLCGGWPGDAPPSGDASFRLLGNHQLVNQTAAQLAESLQAEAIEAGPWFLPIFFSEQLQSKALFPVFFHPRDLAAAWVKAGRPEDSVPEKLSMMDIRSFVAMMQKADNPWQLVQFITSSDAVELANKLQGGAAGTTEGAAAGASAPDDGEEDVLVGQQEDEEL